MCSICLSKYMFKLHMLILYKISYTQINCRLHQSCMRPLHLMHLMQKIKINSLLSFLRAVHKAPKLVGGAFNAPTTEIGLRG